jgi:hypothetical protein
MFDIVQYLVEPEPAPLQMTAGYERVPLQLACKNEIMDSKTINLILNAWPEASQQRSRFGELPIHDLCDNHRLDDTAALDILNMLLGANPQSVRETNEDGGL